MKRIMMAALVLVGALALAGCQKNESLEGKLDKTAKSVEKSADKASKDADKAAKQAKKDADKEAKKAEKAVNDALNK
jgi:outer membrane murein-binding lipoprotein Lpp